VLRLATTLLTDSFRSTLCLQHPPLQMAWSLVFMALQIMNLKPQASSGASHGYGRLSQGSGAESDSSWLDFMEKDVEDSVVQGAPHLLSRTFPVTTHLSDSMYIAIEPLLQTSV
jgi:hypothetical protein